MAVDVAAASLASDDVGNTIGVKGLTGQIVRIVHEPAYTFEVFGESKEHHVGAVTRVTVKGDGWTATVDLLPTELVALS